MGGQSTDPLRKARQAYDRQDWSAAFERFADCESLDADDLERMGWAGLWSGRYQEVLDVFERAHRAFVTGEEWQGAARVALALCQCNWDQRNHAVSQGWWKRAAELLEGRPESHEHGLLLWYQARGAGVRGDPEEHERLADAAYEIGRRVGSRDVQALALLDRGAARVARGEIADGVSLIDQAAALAVSGDLTPGTTGTVYCGVIYACRCRGDWSRASQWTETTNRWLSRTRLSYFPGLCRTHRSEVLRMKGEYEPAERESLAGVEALLAASPQLAGFAYAELGEVRRRRGDLAGAMEAFRSALQHVWEPQPGLALLMLAQGDARSAQKSMDRTFSSPMPTWLLEDMTSLLAARVTVALAAGETETARKAADTLDTLAGRTAAPADMAAAAYAGAEIALTDGDSATAVDRLLVARRFWGEMEAPYEVARSRALLADALGRLGDHAGAALELEAAVGCFSRIGAEAERERTERLIARQGWGASGPAPIDQTAVTPGVFRQEGDFWTVSLGKRTLRLKNSRGLGYIAALLASPGVEILAADLATGPRDGSTGGPADRLATAGDGDAGERLDRRAASEYRTRLEELRDELAEAEARNDAGGAAKAREEMDFLARELAAAFGLGGKARRDGSRAERARQSVTKAIRKVIRRLQSEDPEIGRLLDATIKTGTFCRYRPDPRVSWQL